MHRRGRVDSSSILADVLAVAGEEVFVQKVATGLYSLRTVLPRQLDHGVLSSPSRRPTDTIEVAEEVSLTANASSIGTFNV